MKKSYKDVAAAALAAFFVLSIAGPTAALADGPAAVNLGSAGNFAILAKTGISVTGATSVVGDIGVSPAAATYITGFGLSLPAASAFSTSPLVTGKVYASTYADPTPASLTAAVLDMQNAYTDGAGRAATATELGAGNIGGLTIAAGTYKWGTGVTIPTNVTLSGGASDVWIFQVAQTLTVSSGVQVVLSGGARASNVYWIVAGQTTIGTTADFSGNIIDQTAIVLNTGARLNGRALAQTAVTLDANAVAAPGASSVVSTPPVPTPPVTSTQTTSTQTSSGSSSSGQSSNSANAPVVSTSSQNITTNVVGNVAVNAVSSSVSGRQARSIAVNLGKGARSNDVAILQAFLISQDNGPASSSLARAGATGYFGDLTRSALAEFQGRVGVSPALGNFGPITRAYLGAHY